MPAKPPPAPPAPRLPAVDADALRAYFLSAQDHYAWLFSGVTASQAALESRPHPFRNTLGFYFGHTAAFYAQKLKLVGLLDHDIDARLDRVLERGVSPERALEDADCAALPDGPTLAAYRLKARDAVLAAIDRADFSAPVDAAHPAWAILMGVEHEFLHFHTSAPLIRQTDADLLALPEGWSRAPANASASGEAGWVATPGGEVAHGRLDAETPRYYGWDNEFGRRDATIAPFEVRDRPVTNREFLAFVEDDGYARRELWTTREADIWFSTMRPARPAAWRGDPRDGYRYRCVFEEIDMPWDWPVEVSRHEAQAYANWAGAALISEAQYHHAVAAGVSANGARNVGLKWCSPSAADAAPGKADLIGSVARWTRDHFAPLDEDAFAPHQAYQDFSAPWFGPEHGVMAGASYAAMGHMAQTELMRDFMQNHMDQLAGVTLVREATA